MRFSSSKMLSALIAGALSVSVIPAPAFGLVDESGIEWDVEPGSIGNGSLIQGGRSETLEAEPPLREDEDSDTGPTDGELADTENGPDDPDSKSVKLEEESEPELTPLEVAQPDDNITAFVKRLYQYVLGREADSNGLKVHVDSLRSGMTGAALIWAFFSSPEFQGRHLSDADAVETVYLTLLDRPSDPSGKAFWVDRLDSGMSLCAVVAGSCGSQEFRSLCAKWGIAPGSVAVAENRDKNSNVTAFVQRLYQKVLGRTADAAGLNTHTGTLLSKGNTAALIWAFFSSPEFQGRHLSDADAVETVYLTLLDRPSDPSGKAFWVDRLDSGMSLCAVVAGSCGSQEFRSLCAKWGIAPGSVAVAENRDKNSNVTAFVQRLYQKVLGRTADAEGLNTHTGSLLSGGDASSLAWKFFSSPEFLNRNLSNEAKIDAVYQALLGREADLVGKAGWIARLNAGESFQSLFPSFTGSLEFRDVCLSFGIDVDRYWSMDIRVSSLSSRTHWLIAVDTNKCLVSVYTGRRGNWNPVKRFDCAPGKSSTPSKKGIFTVGVKGYVFGSGYSCYYFTQYSGDYLFHSILYDPGTFTVQDDTMGRPVSHGCIRMWLGDAKYIHDRVPSGSTVYVY